jgi:hypothetical protein
VKINPLVLTHDLGKQGTAMWTTVRFSSFKYTVTLFQTRRNGNISSGREKLVLRSLGGYTTAGNSSGIASELGVCRSSNVLALTSDIELIHMLEGIFDGGAVHEFRVPGSEVRELAGDVEVGGKEMADGVVVVFDEGQISDGAFVTDEPGACIRGRLRTYNPPTYQAFLLRTSLRTLKMRLISPWNLFVVRY